MKNITLVLDNIRSCHNVGAILRTADSLGAAGVVMCGITPTPIDRFGRLRSDVSKVSLGAEDSVSWKHVASTFDFLKQVKSEGGFVVCLEQDERSVSLESFNRGFLPRLGGGVEALRDGGVFLVLGNEVDGVSSEVLEISDLIVEIKQEGIKESLNVSVAAGIALFAFRALDNVQ